MTEHTKFPVGTTPRYRLVVCHPSNVPEALRESTTGKDQKNLLLLNPQCPPNRVYSLDRLPPERLLELLLDLDRIG